MLNVCQWMCVYVCEYSPEKKVSIWPWCQAWQTDDSNHQMVCDPSTKAASRETANTHGPCTLSTTQEWIWEVLLFQVSHPLSLQRTDKGWSLDNWAYMSKKLDAGTLKQFKERERCKGKAKKELWNVVSRITYSTLKSAQIRFSHSKTVSSASSLFSAILVKVTAA